MNIHKSDYQYNILLNGTSSAPGIFLRALEKMLKDERSWNLTKNGSDYCSLSEKQLLKVLQDQGSQAAQEHEKQLIVPPFPLLQLFAHVKDIHATSSLKSRPHNLEPSMGRLSVEGSGTASCELSLPTALTK
ncbi:hypothetical protein Y1Q_0014527 [Alligator mississippiensis]|uniref:Uncharacterized protein n=1 Tax=Alligator mississippiensis TaxID=8496 RepID=A0A151PD83_ALLMI|nr:hypothetical protein Y1Q_0014527 [Alligator mississippiensis]